MQADQPNVHQPAPTTRSRAPAWAAYAACALAWLYAVPSCYWALGGTAGLDTVGGAIQELARTRDPAGVALGIGAGVLKVAGGLLALALVRPWGRAIPRRLLRGVAWAASMALTGYGGLLVAVGTLVLTGMIGPSGPVDRTALGWHVLLWDLWFLVWGLVLGVAASAMVVRSRTVARRRVPGGLRAVRGRRRPAGRSARRAPVPAAGLWGR
jgi:hypothetical protein